MKKIEDNISDFDFGFSFSEDNSEKQTEVISEKTKLANDLEDRLDKLYDAIIPFLDNLCKNPDKPTIHWPNRVDKIKNYKAKLLSIKKGTDLSE